MSWRAAWPTTTEELGRVQVELGAAAANEPRWVIPADRPVAVAGAFVAYRRGVYGAGAAGDEAWAAAAVYEGGKRVAVATLAGTVGAPYIPGSLALREGPVLDAVVRMLLPPPEVVLFDSTGWDHPRRAGLALHLGAVLDLPTVGVTDRSLVAHMAEPAEHRGSRTPLTIDDEVVGYALRTQDGVKPILVHAAWRTDPETACAVVLAVTARARTPEPLREARRLAKEFRPAERAPG